MHVIEVTETGRPEVMRNVEKPTPSPGPGEVLIKAEAIGVNFVDTADAIGAYAEYCIAAADVVALVPDGITADVAAAAILKGMTAHLLIKRTCS
jgi:NADPH:quinone reductase